MADITPEFNPPVVLGDLRQEMNRFFAQIQSDLRREARRQHIRRVRVLCERYLGGKGASNKIVDGAFRALMGACVGLIVAGIIVFVTEGMKS